MTFEVSFRPHADTDLAEIYDFIAEASSRAAAEAFVSRITAACRNLSEFPERGRSKSMLGPGIRLLALMGRATIAYRVEGRMVRILRIFYAGRDYGADDFRR